MEMDAILRKPVVYVLPGMEHVSVRGDIVYKTVDAKDLLADVYLPPDAQPGERRPAVLFIHGDGPAEMIRRAKDMGQYTSWGRLVAACGLVGVTFNHRSSEDRIAKMPEVAGDVDALIRYVREHAEDLGIDADRLGVWACSAGVPYLQGVMADPPVYVRCIAAYYGMMDLRMYAESLPEAMEPQVRSHTVELLNRFSLITHLEECAQALPPMFIAQAGLDDPTLNATIDFFVAQSGQLGAHVEFHRHPAGNHAFDIFNDDDTSRGIIQKTLEFIRRYL